MGQMVAGLRLQRRWHRGHGSFRVAVRRWRTLPSLTAIVALLAGLLVALVAVTPASAQGLGIAGTIYENSASFSGAPVYEYDAATGTETGSFVPPGQINGRGAAMDPDGAHLWVTWVDGNFLGDGLIHELNLPGGSQARTIPDPGGAGGPGIGAIDFDPATGYLWGVSYNSAATIYAFDTTTGSVVKTCAMNTGDGTDTLAVAHPADQSGKTLLLSDFGEYTSDTLYAVDPSTCQIVTSYTLPFPVTGIDEDPTTRHLIAVTAGSNCADVYDLGTAPYSSVVASFPDAAGCDGEDISVGAGLGVIPEGSLPGADLQGGVSPSEVQCACTAGDPVQLATGDYAESSTDISVPGTGIPLAFTRTYDSLAAQAGRGSVASGSSAPDLGAGWFDNLDASVKYVAPTATVTEENGAQITFQYYTQGASEPAWCPSDTSSAMFCATAPRMLAQLSNSNGTSGTWTFVRRTASPLTLTFNSSGVLTGMSDQAGHTVSSASYTGSACPRGDTCTAWSESSAADTLVVVQTKVGKSLQTAKVFELNSGITATFTISTTTCASPSSTLPVLCSATDPGSLTTSYSYQGSTDDLTTMTPPSGGIVTNTYTTGKVSQQCISPSGGVSQLSAFSYVADSSLPGGLDTTVTTYPQGPGNGCSVSGTPLTDVTVYKFSNDVLVEVDQSPGGAAATTTRYTIDPSTLLPRTSTDGDLHVSSEYLNNYRISGSQYTSADPTLQTDGAGNQTQRAFTADNLVWCQVDAADYLNGVRCPASQPSGPPSPGASYQYRGVSLDWYDSSNNLVATTDPLGDTTVYADTSGISGVPNSLRYCSVDPVDYQKNVACPAYGAAHVTGTQTETFDSSGKVLISTDANGNTTTNCYYYQTTGCAASAPSGGSGGNPQLLYSTTDPNSTITSYTYNGAGNVLTQVKAFGTYKATTVDAYTSAGLPYCTISPLAYSQGHTACPTPAPTSPPAAGADPWPGATITIYDNTARPVYSVNSLGGVTETAYDGSGETYCSVSATSYANGIICPAAPPSNPPTVGNDPYLGATINSFDSDGRTIQVTNPLGGITLNVYDSAGNVTQTTTESNNPNTAPNVVTTNTYDADNRVATTTVDPNSPLAATTQRSYDPNGNVYCSVSAKVYAQGTSAYQCPAWQATWITTPPSPSGLYSSTPTVAQANNVTTSFYDPDGHQLQSTDPNIHTTISALDGDGRLYCSADPTNVSSWLSAHPSGTYPYLCPATAPNTPPAQGSNPGYVTTIFDAAGHQASSTDPIGDTTTYTYDPGGQALTTTDPRGKVTTNCYYHQNSPGQCAAGAPAGGGSGSALYSVTTPVTTADPNGETTTTTYFPGDLSDITTNPGGTATNAYDAAGDLTSTAYTNTASGYTTPTNPSYAYNQDGTRHTMVDATGTTTYGYDNAGHITSQILVAKAGSGLANQTTSYTYFSDGLLASITYPPYPGSANPVVSYTYDATGTMTSETDWNGNQVTFGHDQDGNVTSQDNNVSTTNPSGTSSTSFSYDNADQNTVATSNVAQTCGGYETLTQSFSGSGGSRNADNQVTADSENYSGSCSGQTSYQRYYSYDIARRVVYQGSTPQGSNPNNFAYDPSGDLTTISTHDSQGNFDIYTQTFDSAGETLSQAPITGSQGTSSTFGYNTLGGLVTSSAATTGGAYSYDQTGRMTGFQPTKVTQLSAGAYFSLALKSDGTVWSWGANNFGQLGNNSTTASSAPVQVAGLTGVTAIAAGYTHSLALKSDGTVWAWGDGSDGDIGDGSTVQRPTPVQVHNLTGVVAVAAGSNYSVAVKSDGTVWAWGYNGDGELGNGSTTSSYLPTQVNTLTSVSAVAAGASHALALKSDGTVWAWGLNSSGQLGNGTTTNSLTPTQVSGITAVNALAGGYNHSVALKADGTVWAWGDNSQGELGNGTNTNSKVPVQVSGLTGVTAISAHYQHTLALKSDGTVSAWGYNAWGQLGNATTTNTNSPVQVTGLSGVTAVAAGNYHSLAIKSDGTVWAWGYNTSGQLGDGQSGTITTPIQVAALSSITKVAAGYMHSLGLKSDGTVWAWGYNNAGQLGNGTTTDSATPVQVTGLSGVVAIAAGDEFSLAVKSDGTVWAWGYNAQGQLGNGTTNNSSVPVQVTGLTGITAIAAGNYNGLALKSDGTVWAWGFNGAGQLGTGNTTSTTTPVQAASLTGVTAIAAGYDHGLAVKSDGTAWAWGDNYNGELGNNTTTNSDSPVQVNGLTSVTSVSGGYGQSLALKTDGTVWAWGYNSDGELGNGTTTQSLTAVQVSGLTSVSAISAGWYHGLALKSDGTEWAWGNNAFGQLGNNSYTNRLTPIQVNGISNANAISGGYSHSLTATTNGNTWAWGDNSRGQLGTNTAYSSTPILSAQNATSAPVSYLYNGDGQEAEAVSNGATKQFMWDPGSSQSLILSDGANDYIYGAAGTPVEQISLTTSTPTYLTYTPSDSSWLSTNAAGDQTGFWRYDAYGTLSFGTPTSPFGYSGQYLDASTGLVNDRARWFQPQSGGFTTRDPIFSRTDTAYTYARDDPVNQSDPTGLVNTVAAGGFGPAVCWAVENAIVDQINYALWFAQLSSLQQRYFEEYVGLPTSNGIQGAIGAYTKIEPGAEEFPSAAPGLVWNATTPSGLKNFEIYGPAVIQILLLPSELTGPEATLAADNALQEFETGLATAVPGAAGAAGSGGGQGLLGVQQALSGLSPGRSPGVWTVPSAEDIQPLFDFLTEGGTPVAWKNYSGPVVELPDGTQIGMRSYSGSGGPTIDIRPPGGANQLKIHVG